MIASPTIPNSIRLSPDRFYWCVIESSPWKRPGPLPPGLMASLADEVPIDVDLLHAVGAQASDGSLFVCAIRRDALDELGRDCLSLTPAELPEGMDANGLDPGTLELLVGDYEPRAIRRARTGRSLILALAITLCCTALALGLHKRASAARDTVREISAELADIDTTSIDDTLATRRALTDELSRQPPPSDMTRELAEILAAWPVELGSPRSISVTAQQINIAATTERDPSALIQAVTAPAGWVTYEPRITTAGSLTRVSFTMKPDRPGGKP